MKNARVGLFLLLGQIVYVLFSAVWIIVAFASFMMFDQPEALTDPATLALFLLVWLYPVALLVSAIVSWVKYHRRKFKTAAWLNCIPLLWVVPILAAINL